MKSGIVDVHGFAAAARGGLRLSDDLFDFARASLTSREQGVETRRDPFEPLERNGAERKE